jgi:hypothetical protein
MDGSSKSYIILLVLYPDEQAFFKMEVTETVNSPENSFPDIKIAHLPKISQFRDAQEWDREFWNSFFKLILTFNVSNQYMIYN